MRFITISGFSLTFHVPVIVGSATQYDSPEIFSVTKISAETRSVPVFAVSSTLTGMVKTASASLSIKPGTGAGTPIS